MPAINTNTARVIKNKHEYRITGLAQLDNTRRPTVKIKKINGTTSSTESGIVTIAHDLDFTKIIGIQALVNNDFGNKITHGFTGVAGFEYSVFADKTNIFIINHSLNSEKILNKAFTVLITYEE